MELSEFWTICSGNGIVLEPGQLKKFERYEKELRYWNEKVNVISRKDEDNIYERHILHSLAILKYAKIPNKARCIDVGTGGGLPGIPLAIARPDLYFLLVDSIEKKIKVTEMLARHTELRNIKAMRARAEELANENEYIRHFDIVVSRAVAKIASVTAWVKNIIKPDAKLIFLKGGDLSEEIREAQDMHKRLIIKEHTISMFGVPRLEKDEKKVVICHFG